MYLLAKITTIMRTTKEICCFFLWVYGVSEGGSFFLLWLLGSVEGIKTKTWKTPDDGISLLDFAVIQGLYPL